MRSKLASWVGAGASLIIMLGTAAADDYPSRPIRLVNPFQAGGGLDVAARMIQATMAKRLGQDVIIDNRPGAGGMIGAGQVASAAADGYTILITTSGPVVNSLQQAISYDVKTAFQPITRVMTAPIFLVVPESSPIKSVADLIARGKDTTLATSYGHPGNGTATHFAAALFTSMTGGNFVGIPYKGAAGQATDTISGQLQFGFLSAPDAMSHLGHGLRALAVASLKRTPLAPDVPTISESGVPGYQFDLWYGLFAPAHTPRPIVDRIRDALIATVNDETIRARFLAVGMVPDPTTPEEFATVVQNQIEVDTRLVKSLGLRPE